MTPASEQRFLQSSCTQARTHCFRPSSLVARRLGTTSGAQARPACAAPGLPVWIDLVRQQRAVHWYSYCALGNNVPKQILGFFLTQASDSMTPDLPVSAASIQLVGRAACRDDMPLRPPASLAAVQPQRQLRVMGAPVPRPASRSQDQPLAQYARNNAFAAPAAASKLLRPVQQANNALPGEVEAAHKAPRRLMS